MQEVTKGKKENQPEYRGWFSFRFGLRFEEHNLTKALHQKSGFRSVSLDQNERRSPVQEFELGFLQVRAK